MNSNSSMISDRSKMIEFLKSLDAEQLRIFTPKKLKSMRMFSHMNVNTIRGIIATWRQDNLVDPPIKYESITVEMVEHLLINASNRLELERARLMLDFLKNKAKLGGMSEEDSEIDLESLLKLGDELRSARQRPLPTSESD